MDCAIRTCDLSKRYRRTPVLDRVNLQVPPGSIYGLVGANGAGKTTTIKVLMNILTPNSGRCEVLGADSRRLSASHFAQIGYVSENQEMPDWMTVGYFLDYLSHFYPTWDRALASRTAAPVSIAARPPAARPVARHAHESRARLLAGLPAAA